MWPEVYRAADWRSRGAAGEGGDQYSVVPECTAGRWWMYGRGCTHDHNNRLVGHAEHIPSCLCLYQHHRLVLLVRSTPPSRWDNNLSASSVNNKSDVTPDSSSGGTHSQGGHLLRHGLPVQTRPIQTTASPWSRRWALWAATRRRSTTTVLPAVQQVLHSTRRYCICGYAGARNTTPYALRLRTAVRPSQLSRSHPDLTLDPGRVLLFQ